jgi:hypothetical protein
MADSAEKTLVVPESSYVLADRDYADVVHLENPGVIERVLSGTRTEGLAYVSALLQSGIPRYVLAGPKVAFTAMAIEALTDLSREISAWRKAGRIPEDFSGRPCGYQTWVDLLREIDSDPVDADRLKAMKAMFLAANRVDVTEGQSIAAYQLFQIAKTLNSGELLLLKAIYDTYLSGSFDRIGNAPLGVWASGMAGKVGHGLKSLVLRDEPGLVRGGLIQPRFKAVPGQVDYLGKANEEAMALHQGDTGRMTDLGIRFCENLETYRIEAKDSQR